MARVDTLTNYLTDVASAIKTKKGDSTPILASNFDTEIVNLPTGANLQSKSIEITTNTTTTINPDTGYDGMSSVSVVTNVSGGGTEVPEKDVNFYDYDGERLYSYTKEEFLLLESLPPTKAKTGMTVQEWNWTLENAKSYVSKYGGLIIGQICVTSDGKTRLYITLTKDVLNMSLTLNPSKGALTIDWGDGTTPTPVNFNYNAVTTEHSYSNEGDYVIEITANSGFTFSSGNSCSYLLRKNSSQKTALDIYRYLNCLTKVEVGANVDLGRYCFTYCINLKSINLTNYMVLDSTMNKQQIFSNCYSLKCIIIPKTQTYLMNQYFSNCYNLEIVSIPNEVDNIYNGFYNAVELKKIYLSENLATLSSTFIGFTQVKRIKIPKSLDTIKTNVFEYSSNLYEIDFTDYDYVPTLSNVNAFNNIGDYKIIVPDNLYNSWIASSNWSSISSHIVRESDYY